MITTLLIATLFFIAINLFIGFWNNRNLDFEAYVSYKNKSSSIFITLSIVATIVGGGMFFATGQMGYEAGVAGLSLPLSYILGFILLHKFIPKIKELTQNDDCNTLYDVINLKFVKYPIWGKYYNYILLLINFSIYFFLLAGQFLILSTFYKYLLPLSHDYSLLISVLIIITSTFIYSIFGGIKKDIITDAFQMFCIIFGTVLLSFFVFDSTVLLKISELPSRYLNGTGYGIAFPIGVILFFSFSFIVRYDFWQRIIAAKNTKTAKNALWYSIPLIIFFYLLFTIIGMYSKSINPNLVDTNFATLYAFETILPSSVYIVIIVSLYAAVMSSADTFLNISSYSFYKLFLTKINKNELKIARLSALGIGLFSALFVLISENIVNLMVGAFSSLIIISPSMIYIIFSKNPHAKHTTLTTFISYIIFLFIFLFIPNYEKYAFIIGTVISLLLHLIILLLDKFANKNKLLV